MECKPLSGAEESLVLVEVADAVATLTLNRAEKRNAVSVAVIRELEQCLDTLPDSVRCLVLAARGEHFSAGLDLAEVPDMTAAQGVMHSRSWYGAFGKLQFGRVPVVCAMQGAVVGGGLELAACAHVRVADETAYFGLPEGQRGIFLGGGGSVRVSRLIGFSRVTEMMLTGRVYGAEDAFRIGLTHHVVPAGGALTKARELALRIARNAPMSNFAILHALPIIAEQSMAQGLLTESLMAAVTQSEPEAKQRVAEFLAKRAAKVERA